MALFKRRAKTPSYGFLPKIGYWIEWVVWGAAMLKWIADCLRNMPERPRLPQEQAPDVETD